MRTVATARAVKRRFLDAAERLHKKQVRIRDKGCRFPLCGCKFSGLPLEVSHDEHKGMGGDPTGEKSDRRRMLLLCTHRHRDGPISRDRKTLRSEPLGPQGNDGPVRWLVHLAEFDDVLDALGASPVDIPAEADWRGRLWVEVARESRVQTLERLHYWQRLFLERIARLDW